uniref:Odorant receptor n=1 Tax=Lutzomyia longipalpis TaxID=7200 RepID=A0A7G3AU73_LUTLO
MELNCASVKCFEIFEKLNDFVRPVGCNILDTGKNGVPNKLTYFSVLILLAYCTVTLTSIYQFRENFILFTNALVTLGFSIQGIVKFYTMFVRRHRLLRAVFKSRDFIVEFEGNKQICELFKKYANFCAMCGTMILGLYSFAMSMLLVATVTISYWTKTKIIPYGIVIPLIDYKSDVGYAINMVYMTFSIVYGVIGLYASDYIYVYVMIMAYGQVETIGILCQDLSTYLEKNKENEIQEIYQLFTKTVTAQQLHTEYMKSLEENFEFNSITVIITSMICMAITIFVLIQEVWINGIMIIIIQLWQIFTICLIGGVYMIKINQVQVQINDTKWYLLSHRMQKMFLNVIHFMQNPIEPSACGIRPLNLETFCQV